MSQLSGLQRDVLSLYRSFFRMIRTKPTTSRPNFLLLVRYTFRQNARAVSPRDFRAIEHMLRRGRRQLDMYSEPGVKDCAVSDDMRLWEESRHREP